MTKDEALKMAINVLELYEEKLNSSIAIEVIQTCKEALEQPTNMVTIPLDKLEDMQRRLKEQPTQEPVAWMNREIKKMHKNKNNISKDVGMDNISFTIMLGKLGQNRNKKLADVVVGFDTGIGMNLIDLTFDEYMFTIAALHDTADAIEAKLKEKNT